MPHNLGTKKMTPSLTTMIVVVLQTGWNRIAQAQSTCMSLQTSKACPAFVDFYIGLPGSIERFPFLNGTTDVNSFDNRMFAHVSSASDYLTPLGCLSNGANVPYARYSLTRLCAEILQDEIDTLPCNSQLGFTPPLLCQSTCIAWIDSVTSLTNSTSLCPDPTLRQNALDQFEQECGLWSGYRGPDDQNCISGAMNEPENCGFYNDRTAARKYCNENDSDPCCASVLASSGGGLSKGGLAGVIVGSVAVAGLAVFLFFWFCSRRRKKRIRKDHFSFATYVRPKDDQVNGGSRGTLMADLHNQSTTSNTTSTHLDSSVGYHSHPLTPLSIHENHYAAQDTDNISVSIPTQPTMDELFLVVHPYTPNIGDELTLRIGDIVCLAIPFDDGWALGFNLMTGLKGAFPLVCVAPLPPELMDELAAANDQDHTSKTQVEDNTLIDVSHPSTSQADQSHSKAYQRLTMLNMDKLKENVRRSFCAGPFAQRSEFASQNTIPKRMASIRTTYSYSEPGSPTSPTQSTPFINVTPLSTAVVRPPRNNFDQRSIVANDDTFEMLDQPSSPARTHARQDSMGSNKVPWLQSAKDI